MFKKVFIEISNICNLQCSFCHVNEQDRRIMNPDDFENILKQAVPLSEHICLHLLGEPLAHPQFKEILEICEKHMAPVFLVTNGILIQRYRDAILNARCVRQLNFSLQAFRDNFPEADIDPYLLPIFEFIKSAHASRPELYTNLRLWNLDNNKSDNEEVYSRIESFFNVSINRNIELGAIKSKNIRNRLYLNFDSRFEWPSFSLPFQGKQGRCHGTINQIGIHADGSVVPCCLDQNATIALGNAKDESLDAILKGERLIRMREGFNNGILTEKLCQHCSFIRRFNKSGKFCG